MKLHSFAYQRTCKLSSGYTVDFILDSAGLSVEWSPRQPNRKATQRIMAEYVAARNDFLRSLNMNVAVSGL